MPVTVGPSTLTINHDRQFLISQPNATMAPQDDVGFYARDTRFVSGYAVTINGRLPRLLDAITVEHFSARYEFMTPFFFQAEDGIRDGRVTGVQTCALPI